MIRLLLVVIVAVGLLYFILRSLIPTSSYKSCEKCDGKGFWTATRGERDRCDACNGSGKMLR